jgi:hypothetical protein
MFRARKETAASPSDGGQNLALNQIRPHRCDGIISRKGYLQDPVGDVSAGRWDHGAENDP